MALDERGTAEWEQVPTVPHVEWEQLPTLMRWQQGEHVALVGPTGGGKTTAAMSLAELRGYVVLVNTKPADRTTKFLRRHGWEVIKSWPSTSLDPRRVMLHAPIVDLDTDPPKVGRVVGQALNGAYKAQGWTIVLDDLQALNDTCGLARLTRTLLLNARSSYVTVVASTQRPRYVPREVWTQSTHLFIWRCVDRDDLRQLSGLGNADSALVRQAVQSLDWDAHEVLYVNTRTGALAITVSPPPPR